MTTNRAIKTILILFFLIFPFTVYAWDSMGDENHRTLTNDAINDLGISNYPDLDKYRGMYGGDGVVEGSATESSHSGQWEGPYTQLEDDAYNAYKSFEFKRAYDFYGRFLHLRQDIFVPAHIKKCAHGIFLYRLSDNFESFANWHHTYSPDTVTPWGGYDNEGHYWKYWLDDSEDDDDGDETTADVNDSAQKDGPNSYNLLSTWGTYGRGTWPNDLIPGSDQGSDWYNGSGISAYIVYEQLYFSYSDTKAKLKEFSESLPPLVKDLDITSSLNCNNIPYINSQSGAQISFKILENCKKTVKIFITVGGEAIISSEYSTGKAFDLPSGTDLPWEGTYSVTWDGKLANGQYPSGGEHTLYVTQCEITSQKCEKISLHNYFTSIATLRINFK